MKYILVCLLFLSSCTPSLKYEISHEIIFFKLKNSNYVSCVVSVTYETYKDLNEKMNRYFYNIPTSNGIYLCRWKDNPYYIVPINLVDVDFYVRRIK